MTTTNLTATATTTSTMPLDTPIGQIVLESDGDVLIGLRLPNAVGLGRRDEESPILKEAATQLEEYFAGERAEFDLRMEFDGTPFQREVWSDPAELRRSLVALPGIGPWTAEYVAMRALRDPDAFMPTDLGIRRGALALGLPDDPTHLRAMTEHWRPWRSYAMAHLWAMPAAAPRQLPTRRTKGRAA